LNKNDLQNYSPLSLAYLGDAVIELLVRNYLLENNLCTPNSLHKKALIFVSATAQSHAFALIEPHLTDEEKNVYRHGRNAKNSAIAKHANATDYRRATGMEALFGYLHLLEDFERIQYLFKIAYFPNDV